MPKHFFWFRFDPPASGRFKITLQAMSGKRKLLFIYKNTSSFIEKDKAILSNHFDVKSFSFNPSKKVLTPFTFFEQFLFLLRNSIGTRVIICEFAGYHTLFPLILAKIKRIPSLLIICGTEGHSFPSINYGNHTKKLMAWFTCKSLRMASHILPVHKSLVYNDYSYDDKDSSKQGYRNHCKNVKTPFTEINYGYDERLFYNNQQSKIPNSFLTVALNAKGSMFYRKGIDLILEAARNFPDFTFTLLGAGNSLDHLSVAQNVKLLPPMPYETLITHFSSHEFYFQLSMAEGFPNALCEAMLCECIPIGSSVNGIPDIIGDTGFILRKKNDALLKSLIVEAVNSEKRILAKKARQRIVENFPLEKREKEMIEAIENLL